MDAVGEAAVAPVWLPDRMSEDGARSSGGFCCADRAVGVMRSLLSSSSESPVDARIFLCFLSFLLFSGHSKTVTTVAAQYGANQDAAADGNVCEWNGARTNHHA